ncbi:MAG: fibronectin type III domain-containing protein [Bdellovibrio sp.]|nr:fibronectin type III domain-containing protein [Bdellovibrio sp.]
MKFVLAAFVFFLALGFTAKSVASAPEVCSAEKTENCTSTEKDHTEHTGPAVDHHAKLSKEMNSLFPEKQKNPTVTARPATVKLTSPKFLASISEPTAKLEWSAADGATSYHVQVATDPNFKWLVANDYKVKTTSFEIANLEADHKYFWRVASIKDENEVMFTKSLFVSSVFSTPVK